MMRFFVLMGICVFVSACSGPSEPTASVLIKPISIVLSDENISVGGDTIRFGYVLDEHSKAIVVFDLRDDRVVDVSKGDGWDRTPLPAGDQPVAIAIDNTAMPHKVFVADAQNQVIWGYQLAQEQFSNKDDLAWDTLELGSNEYQSSSRPLFFNKGAQSALTLQDITNIDLNLGVENWVVRHRGDERFEVIGSVSGEQSQRARQSTTYETDDQELSFLIQPGGRVVSDRDRFHFSSMRAQPFELSATPSDIQASDGLLYILTQDADELVIWDIDDQTLSSTVALGLSQPKRINVMDDEVLIVDGQTNVFQVYDIDGASLSSITLAELSDLQIKYVSKYDDLYYVIGKNDFMLYQVNASGEVDARIDLNEQPNDLTVFENIDEQQLLVALQSGNVDLIDLDDFSRVDTEPGDDADFSSVEFFDTGAPSSPNLISVGTFDDKTRTEQWQLIYEGVLPGIGVRQAEVSGTTVTFTDLDLANTSLQEGDIVEIQEQDYAVVSIDSATTLSLSEAPEDQSTQTIRVRSLDSYVAIGSKSGVQQNRVQRDENYTSDDEIIALFIRSSLDRPVTRGDFFTFATVEGTNPINTTGRSIAVRTVVTNKPGKTFPTGYVLYQGAGAMGRITFKNLEVNKIIR